MHLQMVSQKEIALAATFICMIGPSGGTSEPACAVLQSYEHGFTANIRLVRSRRFSHSHNCVVLNGFCAPHTLDKLMNETPDLKVSYYNVILCR